MAASADTPGNTSNEDGEEDGPATGFEEFSGSASYTNGNSGQTAMYVCVSTAAATADVCLRRTYFTSTDAAYPTATAANGAYYNYTSQASVEQSARAANHKRAQTVNQIIADGAYLVMESEPGSGSSQRASPHTVSPVAVRRCRPLTHALLTLALPPTRGAGGV